MKANKNMKYLHYNGQKKMKMQPKYGMMEWMKQLGG